MVEPVRRRYEAMAQSGELAPDPDQQALADALDRLVAALGQRALTSKKSSLGWLFARHTASEPPRGLYIWGGVGRGKTLLMDLFFAAAPGTRKRRVHFHEFMGEAHDRMKALRSKLKGGEVRGDDPIASVASGIAADADLLCFDEFAVNDIADAMILGRLFEQLFARGTTIVATSNTAPEDLYKDGLNRALFLPFIALLQERMTIFHLGGTRDYRLEGSGSGPRYVTPLGPAADAALAAQFRRLSGAEHGSRVELAHKGRRVAVPEASNGVARFGFADLCARPLAAGDYLKIANAFSTIILAGVPVLGPATRNEAKRLINLIDTLYDKNIRLIVSAEAEPEELWQGREGVEAHEFARTASRLREMRTDAYWAAASDGDADVKTARAG